MGQSTDRDHDKRWEGLRAACRYFHVGRLASLVSVLIAVACAGAIIRCQPVWLSVAAYVLLLAGLLYGARPLFRLGLDAHAEQLKPLAKSVRPGVARLDMRALGQRVHRRYDAFAALLGVVLPFVGLTLSTLVLPVLRALGAFTCTTF